MAVDDNLLLPPIIEKFVKDMFDSSNAPYQRDNCMATLEKYRDSIDNRIQHYKQMRDLETLNYRKRKKD